jgi:hypothetical protein
MAGKNNTMYGMRWVSNSKETKLIKYSEFTTLIKSGEWIAGKKATIAPCGCLVVKRCIACENKKQLYYDNKNAEFKISIRKLFDEFIETGLSVTAFAKMKGTSQPRLSIIWKKYIPEYSEKVKKGKSFNVNDVNN